MIETFDKLRFDLFRLGASRTLFTLVNNEYKVEYCRDNAYINIYSCGGHTLYGYLKVTDKGIEVYKFNAELGAGDELTDKLSEYSVLYDACSKVMETKSFNQFCRVLEEAKSAIVGDLNYATWILDGLILHKSPNSASVTVTPVCDQSHVCRVLNGKLEAPKEYAELFTAELTDYILQLVKNNFQATTEQG